MCNVTVFVIAGAAYPSSYEYCKQESFHIEIKFNHSFYILPDNQEVDLSKQSRNMKELYMTHSYRLMNKIVMLQLRK